MEKLASAKCKKRRRKVTYPPNYFDFMYKNVYPPNYFDFMYKNDKPIFNLKTDTEHLQKFKPLFFKF